ncbi:MAG: Rpn family recombination-promoting nuclease/putative transposase [Acetatifactor sp.]|nr:Rpn family recombination-promoting nuclease/putative transposase [Acetatifactor sp.]
MEIISLKYDFSFKYLMLNEKVRRYFIADALGIPAEEIRSIRLANTFLWKRYFWQKQGILDVLVELNDNSKVNIELQIKMLEAWDKRSLFYLAKMFTEDLRRGEKYHRLKKCICINIVDFHVDEEPEYHRVYRLRDKEGHEFSGMFEVHIIELGKELKGGTALDDWIRLINAKTKEELNMIRTMNPGILEAIEEVKAMSLRKGLRALYEAHLKEMRDRMAQRTMCGEREERPGKRKERQKMYCAC